MTDYPPMPLLPISSPTTIEACKSLPLRPSDIFICSYPKSGTTWTQHIVLSLLLADRRYAKSTSNSNSSSETNLNYKHVSDYAPFFEIDAHWDHCQQTKSSLVQSIQSNHDKLNRRVFNTHLRWEMLPKSTNGSNNNNNNNNNNSKSKRPHCGKFIYITRNLLDVCTSFYHHLSNQSEGRYENDFETFAQDWMEGKIAFGSALHHLLSFAEGFGDNRYSCDCNDDNTDTTRTTGRPLLLLSYERMKSNLRKEVLRIMEFLQLNNIPMEALDNELLPSFEFESMKNDLDRFQPKSVTWLNGFTFLRRGESGDGLRMMAGAITTTVDDGEEMKKSLLSEFDEWVEREGYREKIDMLLKNGKDADSAMIDQDMNMIHGIFSSLVNHRE